MKRPILSLAALCLMTSVGTLSAADDQRPPRPSREAVEAAATAMGVTGEDMKDCAEARNNGERPQGRPTKEQHEAMAEEMFTCLQGKNANLAHDAFDSAMKNMRPEQE